MGGALLRQRRKHGETLIPPLDSNPALLKRQGFAQHVPSIQRDYKVREENREEPPIGFSLLPVYKEILSKQ